MRSVRLVETLANLVDDKFLSVRHTRPRSRSFCWMHQILLALFKKSDSYRNRNRETLENYIIECHMSFIYIGIISEPAKVFIATDTKY